DQRQAVASDVVAEQPERSLDRDRVDDDGQQVERRAELLVEAPRLLDVARAVGADHLLDARPDDVRIDTYAPDAADLEERKDERIVTGVQVEAELGDPAGLLEI